MNRLRPSCLFLLVGWTVSSSALVQPPELRGWWVDTWHAAMRNAAEVDALVETARAANFNALFVEVRKRGDAYYDSRFEPVASDVQAGFDPLAHLVQRAHDTSAGARIEVHAWIVTYNIWNNQSTPPPQPDHPYRLHPDWLTESVSGEKWDGSNFAFDPGHPAVQEHTFNVAMDIVSRYNVDGLHFDYVRYAGCDWGYNPVAVARFNASTDSTGRPAPDDSWWMRWRRDQVTALLRRLYMAVTALKPNVKVSAATITWTPTATTFSSWLKAAAWSNVLQDWRAWMEEGILDINVPMAYFRQESHATALAEWSRFARQNRFQRHIAIGTGTYLNTISNSIVQMRGTRVVPGAGIPRADGMVLYSYAVPCKDASRTDFIAALTTSTTNDAVSPPVFATAVVPPPMPWKTDGTVFGITGAITDASTKKPIQSAQVELCIDNPELILADENGVYARMLSAQPPSLVVVSAPGYLTKFHEWDNSNEHVRDVDFALVPDTSDLQPVSLRVSPGRKSAAVSWQTKAPSRGRVLCGMGTVRSMKMVEAFDNRIDTDHSVLVGDLPAEIADALTRCWLRVVSEDPDCRTNWSHAVPVLPAIWPIQVDEWSVRLTGNWTFAQAAAAGARQGFWQTPVTTGPPTATALWRARVEVSGHYDLEFSMFPSAGYFPAVYDVRTPRTNLTVRVNHSSSMTNGLLAANLLLLRGECPVVSLDNRTVSGSAPVAACRMRWVYRASQDPPPDNTLPAWWTEHFFAQSAAPVEDSDGDDCSNYAEFVFGTDPTNPRSLLHLCLQASDKGGWCAVFSPLTAGRKYILECAPDLANGRWEPVSGAELQHTESGDGVLHDPASRSAACFYRLKVQL